MYYDVSHPRKITRTNHRKIVGYIPFVDDYDGDGHGTHVAGSVAGFSQRYAKPLNILDVLDLSSTGPPHQVD